MRVEEVGQVQRIPKLPQSLRDTHQQEPENRKTGRTLHINGREEKFVKEQVLGEKKVIEALEKAFREIMGPRTMIKFSIHEGTKEIMVKVLNEETGEVIREIPPEKILDLVAKIWELAGIIVDEHI